MVIEIEFEELPEGLSENINSTEDMKNFDKKFEAADPSDLLADFDTED